VNRTQLDPVADILIAAYLETASYSRRFRDEHDQPPTLLSKVHHMRSVAQATLNSSDRYDLGAMFVEFSRVEFEDGNTGRRYLLRSDGALAIERKMRQRETIFDAAMYLDSPVALLVYNFHKVGLDLSVAGTRQAVGSKRLEPTGTPTFIAMWPYANGDTPSAFDQGKGDPFGELGGVEDLGEEGEG